MRNKLKATALVAAGLILVLQAFAGLAGASNSVEVTFTVVPTLTLTLTDDGIDFGNVTPGTNERLNQLTTTVSSNTSWTLQAQAPANFTAVDLTLPIGHLSTRTGSEEWKAFVDGSINLVSGSAGGGQNFAWDYSLVINWTDVPADYTANITYTATTN